MVTIPTIRTINHEAISAQNGIISTPDGKVICETESGIPKNFVSADTSVYCGDSDMRLTKSSTRARRYRLSKRNNSPQNKPLVIELEYLESSGTQWLLTGFYPTQHSKLEMDLVVISAPGNYAAWIFCNADADKTDTDRTFGMCANQTNSVWVSFGAYGNTLYVTKTLGIRVIATLQQGLATWGSERKAMPTQQFTTGPELVFYRHLRDAILPCLAIYESKLWEGDKLKRHFVPVLNADGEPGMWDKVSKRFFGNAGTGTFGYALKGQGESSTYSLRNPGVVPPSGVYARKSGENELDIIADTEESTGEGWEWFANTAEAYEHFNIVPEGEEK